MIHIVTDSSSMISPNQNDIPFLHILPLRVQCNEESYHDGVDITSQQVCEFCHTGGIPTSSQPSLGMKIEVYDQILTDPQAQILDITIADGLSGTYSSALTAKNSCADPKRVTVFNSKTLAGPQMHLVEKAVCMVEEGKEIDKIIEALDHDSSRDISMVAVSDCLYLSRSGRVPSLIGRAGALMKLVPIAEKIEEGKKLHLMKSARTMKKAVSAMIDNLRSKGADASYKFYIAYGESKKDAEYARQALEKAFPGAGIFVHPLCALFVVHGGPTALSIQALPA